MKKLDYTDEKVMEITKMLIELGFEFDQLSDSIDIKIPTRESYRKLSHELHKIFYEFPKAPPLVTQFDHSSNTFSIFDRR